MSTNTILYIRFDIKAVEKKNNSGAYGCACYETVFRIVPVDLLHNCQVYMGDSKETLNGNEYVCIIGLSTIVNQLESIRNVLQNSNEFKSVAASNPLMITDREQEPLVSDGVYTENGSLLKSWAKIAFDSNKQRKHTEVALEKEETRIEPEREAIGIPLEQIQTDTTPQQESANIPPQRHGCLTAWIILVIFATVALALLSNLIEIDNIGDIEKIGLIINAIICVVCGILIWNWKKIGFWIFACAAALQLVFSLIGGDLVSAFQSLFPPMILFYVLQKEKNGVSGWNNLKKVNEKKLEMKNDKPVIKQSAPTRIQQDTTLKSVNNTRFPLYTKGGVCDVCSRSLSGVTAYIVPNDVFYKSKAWRAYFRRLNPFAGDAEIEQMRRMDNSQGSAICDNCIYMFN